MALPKNLTLPMLQTQWPQQLDPILANPASNVSILKSQVLVSGKNVINHKLGAPLQGWYTTRVRQSVQLYDQQDSNPTPQLTLVLIASAAATIDLAVY